MFLAKVCKYKVVFFIFNLKDMSVKGTLKHIWKEKVKRRSSMKGSR